MNFRLMDNHCIINRVSHPISAPTHKEKIMDNQIVKIIIALFIPPLAVYLHENKIDKNFWITLVLWVFLLGIGGVIYALYVILKK
jgi:uncharacterized membrane protein YqaE (UPF0057 family)